MALQIFNSRAQLDLSIIDPTEVANLTDEQQEKLAVLIAASKSKTSATDRWLKASAAVVDAAHEQAAALEAHVAANPPVTQQQAHADAIASYTATH